MPVSWLILILAALTLGGYIAGRARARASVQGDVRRLHSLPSYYGYNVALFALVPALAVLALWLLAQPMLIDSRVSGMIPAELIPDGSNQSLVMSDVRRVADGLELAVSSGVMSADEVAALDADATNIRARLGEMGVALGSDVRPEVLEAAQAYRAMSSTGTLWMTVIVLVLALVGLAWSYSRTHSEFRARNVVERGVLTLLILAASIAILTTVGIVLSMLFETINFFSLHDWKDFFLGATWAPNFRGDSELSILPLLWGTLYISLIALIVAVPIGLFAAIYLSEYASKAVRSFAKPLLEILAGIPTIVYGLFGYQFFAISLGLGFSILSGGLALALMVLPLMIRSAEQALRGVPMSYRQASEALSISRWGWVRRILVPQAAPGIAVGIILSIGRALAETAVLLFTAGYVLRQPDSLLDSGRALSVHIYDLAMNVPGGMPRAAATGLVLVAILVILNLLVRRWLRPAQGAWQ